MTDDDLNAAFLAHIESVEHLRNWCLVFLGVDFPVGHVDPDSNSSPAEFMFEAYTAFRNNVYPHGQKYEFVVLSSRDSYKTLSESALAVLLMIHFRASIAHMAAIEGQAYKAIQYINFFLKKIEPFLTKHNITIDNQSKRRVQIKDSDGKIGYINVIIATMQGTNSEHTNVLSVDEVDVMRFPQAYEEAKLIPAYDANTGRFPLVFKTSTRKFAFGLMAKEIELAAKNNSRVLRWNIIDITEKCPPERHKPNEEMEYRYVGKKLPLSTITESEYYSLPDSEKTNYEKIKAFRGCLNCPILPVCRTRLAFRPDNERGGLYKPIQFTINQFKSVNAEMAEAQLMCWKPSQTGLVYPRFLDDVHSEVSNTITIENFYKKYINSNVPERVTLSNVITSLHDMNVNFFAGVDWGYRHLFVIIVSAVLNDKTWVILDCIAKSHLEFEEMISIAEHMRDVYRIKRWFVDQSAPMFIEAFKKRRMPCPTFKKDVLGGIESVRGQIVDASGHRNLKIIKTENTEFFIECIKKHSFSLDSTGAPTDKPSDDEYADVADALRYLAQNLFPVNRKSVSEPIISAPPTPLHPDELFFKAHLRNLTGGTLSEIISNKNIKIFPQKGGNQSKTVLFDFTGGRNDDK